MVEEHSSRCWILRSNIVGGGEEPQVMGAKTQGMNPPPVRHILAYHAPFHPTSCPFSPLEEEFSEVREESSKPSSFA